MSLPRTLTMIAINPVFVFATPINHTYLKQLTVCMLVNLQQWRTGYALHKALVNYCTQFALYLRFGEATTKSWL